MFLFFEKVILERETLDEEQPEKAKQKIREIDTNTVDNVKLRKTIQLPWEIGMQELILF